jgi:hypothetical protein
MGVNPKKVLQIISLLLKRHCDIFNQLPTVYPQLLSSKLLDHLTSLGMMLRGSLPLESGKDVKRIVCDLSFMINVQFTWEK